MTLNEYIISLFILFLFWEREREYNKVQACLGLETFYSKFSPTLVLFQGLPSQLDWFLQNAIVFSGSLDDERVLSWEREREQKTLEHLLDFRALYLEHFHKFVFCFTDGISVAKLSAAVDLPSDTRKRSDGPRLLLTCLDSGLSVQHVSCGLEHSLFLTQHGTVLTCGSGRYECLGVLSGDLKDCLAGYEKRNGWL